jgi:hypothetical protein
MGEAYSTRCRMRNASKCFVGKHERKIFVRKSRRIWDDNIKMDLRGAS